MAIPLYQVVREYPRSSLRLDVAAGISVCVIMIPSVIAYAELAGVPPAHGLYAALAALVGYALFASSRQVVAGPDAAITLLVASAIGPLANGDAARAVALASATALLGGGLMLLAHG
jgi:SulP family sulfate permease